ncbi:MAG: DUF5107 domain-containing protein [Anaerolineae bacterium]|nr:DUF5107 domain-containing protein [Anaerolineae bacterium]
MNNLPPRLSRFLFACLAFCFLALGCKLSSLPSSPVKPAVWTATSTMAAPSHTPPPTATAVPAPSASPYPATPPPPAATAAPAPTSPPVAPTTTAAPPPTAAPQPVAVWEDNITLNSYGWETALVATAPDDPIYPYPRLDFDAVSGPSPRTYRAVYVQNEHVQLVILPALGGRILRWTDRNTGRQLFYANPVLKPTHWGYRGWWLATGGIEWAFPTDEHGLNEYRPWQHQLLWNGVRVWDTDDRTGLTVEVTIQLEAGSSRIAVTPRVSNPTGTAQSYQFWANAMLALSDTNIPSSDLNFLLPASQVVVHSSGDGSLPAPGSAMDWPVHNGRDFGRYAEWHSWLGIFAPQAAAAGFSGAYDLGVDQGVIRVAPAWVRGVKLFCLGDLGAEQWTDDGSRYFELWGGLTGSFWEYTTLAPGESVAWTEYWYAVSGMGGCTWANGEGAVRLARLGNGLEIAVGTVRPVQATIILWQGETERARWQETVGPGRPFCTAWEEGNGPWSLEVRDGNGAPLIHAAISSGE